MNTSGAADLSWRTISGNPACLEGDADELEILRYYLSRAVPEYKLVRLDVIIRFSISSSISTVSTMDPPYNATFRPQFWGLEDDHGRLCLIANYNNDLGDYWEDLDKGDAPVKAGRVGNSARCQLRHLCHVALGDVPLVRSIDISDPLVDVRVDGVIRLHQIAGIEQRLTNIFRIVVPDGIGEDRKQIVDSQLGWLHQFWIVEQWMHFPRVNQTPAVAESISVVAFHVKALAGLVLQHGNRVVASFHQQIHRL